MIALQQKLIGTLNPLFTTSDWIDKLESADEDAILAAARRSGEVVLGQFHGHNQLAGKDVLDFGCGAAGKTLFYAEQGAAGTWGVDIAIDHAGPAIARARAQNLPFEIDRITPENGIPLADASIDVVLSSSVLEHLPDLGRSLSEVFRVLRPGGLFLNRWHPYGTRFGSHLHHVIGIPFAHRLFSEKALIRFYYDKVVARYGKVPESLGGIRRDGVLDDIMPMNRIALSTARKAFSAAGFHPLALRYFRGMTEQPWLLSVPEPLRPAFTDYEVNVLQKPA